ncbi:MAG TPA: HAD-IA family hydrolase [Vicinamibacteria bacterium]|nr:HAD-IA family hydrolase [Vicinamibacteria bacterium]
MCFGRAQSTIKVRLKNILEKLDVQDGTEAVTIGFARGIIHVDDGYQQGASDRGHDPAQPMKEVTAIFSDIGGVILTNGWDRSSRKRAVETFGLDWEEFVDRHDLANSAFELGEISLDEYLHRTVFHRSRPFSREEFKAFLFAQSQELPESRVLLDRLTGGGCNYLVAAINNEGDGVNEYRIDRFDLRRNFTAFFSSCYVGLRKPDSAIYRLALDVTRREPEESVFIDDRPMNVEYAARLGMRAILFEGDAVQLERELARHGVSL